MTQMLEEKPLYSAQIVSPLFTNPRNRWIAFPEHIRVHCAHEKCSGVRRHTKRDNSPSFVLDSDVYAFVAYGCTDCQAMVYRFAIKAVIHRDDLQGVCIKLHQAPAFGHPIPKRLFQVIGEDNREAFLQARRAIGRGLGIGAYAYYRRIVENTKFDLVDSILKVAKATNAASTQIELLERAQSERQFSKAIELLGDVSAIPAVLLIDGQNPLTLLHDLLSEGIHQLADRECLQRAQEAEVILCDIADRMQIALTEKKAVKAALSSIMNRKQKAEVSEPKLSPETQ